MRASQVRPLGSLKSQSAEERARTPSCTQAKQYPASRFPFGPRLICAEPTILRLASRMWMKGILLMYLAAPVLNGSFCAFLQEGEERAIAPIQPVFHVD